jgi:hypothetical protein
MTAFTAQPAAFEILVDFCRMRLWHTFMRKSQITGMFLEDAILCDLSCSRALWAEV